MKKLILLILLLPTLLLCQSTLDRVLHRDVSTYGWAGSYNGSNQYTAKNTDLGLGTKDIMINIWARQDIVPTNNQGIVVYRGGGNNDYLGFLIAVGGTSYNGRVSFSVGYDNVGSVNKEIRSNYNLFTYGGYVLITAVLNRETAKNYQYLYINGVLEAVDSSMTNSSSLSSTTRLTFGYKSGGEVNTSITYFQGQIGEAQIVLFDQITQSNVNATTIRAMKQTGIPLNWYGGGAKTVAHYKFYGNSVTQIGKDWSNSGNNITIFSNMSTSNFNFGQFPTRIGW